MRPEILHRRKKKLYSFKGSWLVKKMGFGPLFWFGLDLNQKSSGPIGVLGNFDHHNMSVEWNWYLIWPKYINFWKIRVFLILIYFTLQTCYENQNCWELLLDHKCMTNVTLWRGGWTFFFEGLPKFYACYDWQSMKLFYLFNFGSSNSSADHTN